MIKPYRAFTSRSTNGRPNIMFVGYKHLQRKWWTPPKTGEGIECPLCGKELRMLLGKHSSCVHNMTPKQFLEKTGMYKHETITKELSIKKSKLAYKLEKEGKMDFKKLVKKGTAVMKKWQDERRIKGDWSNFNKAGRVKADKKRLSETTIITCKKCGNEFSLGAVRDYRQSRTYCSITCYLSDRETFVCSTCGKSYESNPRKSKNRSSLCERCYSKKWKREHRDLVNISRRKQYKTKRIADRMLAAVS